MAVLRPPLPVILSPSPSTSPPNTDSYPEKRENPNATWVPKSERQAADHLDRVDDIEQEEPDEFLLPTSLLPASSNPKAVWIPKSERRTLARREPAPLALPAVVANGAESYGPERLSILHPSPIDQPPSSPSDPERQAGSFQQTSGEAEGTSAQPTVPLQAAFQYSPVRRQPRMQDRVVPILLTIFCLLFLVATSLLASLFLSKRHEPQTSPSLAAMPSSLRANDTFTLAGTGFGADDPIRLSRDNNVALLDGSHFTDALGNFTVEITVSSRWGLGPHTIYVADDAQQLTASTKITIEAPSAAPPTLQLRLSSPVPQTGPPHIDLGAGDPGVVSKKDITLVNGGGGQVTWQANSDSTWLTVTPDKGAFSGSELVKLMVNRGALPPQTYTGYVTFTQQGGTALSLTLSVTMSINIAKAPQALLVLSTASLAYTGSTAQNPPAQVITLQNSGGQPLDWSATAATGDGAPWLSITPNRGHLGMTATTQVVVSIQSQQLAVGSYSGTINFQGGANPHIFVTLNVVAPANLALSSTSLDLQAAQGQKSVGQVTIQDSGGQPLDWTVTTTTTDGANWLSVSLAGGHLNPAGTQNITVTANAGTLAANSYQGTLTFSYGTSSQIYRSPVTVKFTVSLPPMPGISVQPSTLVFNATQGINPSAQTFTITNIGNASLNWATTEDTNGSTYAATSSSGSTSTLAPAKNVTITVTPKVASAGPGTITALITVFDSDKGSTIPKQQVAVTININSAAIINASPGNMVFNQSSTVTSSEQLLSIDNTGSAPLNWSLAQGSQTPASWLSVDTTSGTILPGTTFTVNVTCNSSQLSPGTTYTATLVIKDSDPNSPVLSQTITVTLVVGA